ncbi:MAG: GWxTD domain-containing protein [Bacteroidetes bacterium]|nr:MAG: GWxTD domain-containing protein [Bacteroidota bacterium]
MKLFRTFPLLLLLSFSAAFLPAQEQVRREHTGSDLILFEAHHLPASSDSSPVAVLYRIRHDFFVFTRGAEEKNGGFTASGSIAVEILDSAGTSVDRRIAELSLRSDDNSIAGLRKGSVTGSFTFRLHPGRYRVLFRAEDIETKRLSPNLERPLTVPNRPAFFASSFIPGNAAGDSIVPFTLGGDLRFSSPGSFFASVPPAAAGPLRLTVTRRDPEDDDARETVYDTTVLPLRRTDMKFAGLTMPAVLELPMRSMELPQGRYELTVASGDSLKETVPFGVRWPEMPQSLNDLELATLPLQHIMERDVYSELRKGSRPARIRKFEEYWKSKDPTPGTALNERMTEFYRRVDHTIPAYATLKEPNGSLSDRGKVYILYGRPTTTDRRLSPGSVPQEVWKYDSLKKTFIFEDPRRQGNYTLIERQ